MTTSPQDDLTAARAAATLLERMGLVGHPADAQFIGDIIEFRRQTRQEALREAAREVRTQKADDKVADDLNQTLSFDTYNMTLESVADELGRLASEGA